MKKLVLCILSLYLIPWFIPIALGDNISTKGKWGDDNYRMIVPNAPTLYIEEDILSVQFVDKLTDLVVYITNDTGMVVYECVISGVADEVFEIPLKTMPNITYQVILEHRCGWLQGYFNSSSILHFSNMP